MLIILVKGSASFVTVISVSLVIACGCTKAVPEAAAPAWKIRSGDTHKDVRVTSGTTFQCDGMKCRLLGVKDSADPKIREQAELFTRAWFGTTGDYFGVYNDSNPLMNEGTAVVWIYGTALHLTCLSEQLVRAGLVEPDVDSYPNYSFTVEDKEDGESIEDWREIIREASRKKAEPMQLPFAWPPVGK
ncbi:hypothetical protein [Lacipirellula limnantheis]|uniref:Uncharacterized protein n=1 Tax=Lacipirellula limnantheis TaxID=2528024 RepID=A0A517U522_9BACT|nr:hypothetical protein [Lacipirellula limnantheis]QDT75735.1 hypothetical protein I41_49770 [Lacipirellula limnantheis]